MCSFFLKKYQILSKIGEGSFSEVLKCQNKKTLEIVAAKRLRKIYKSSSDVEGCGEVVAMTKLSNHPNILKMIEFIFDPVPGKVALIFELMEMSLYDMIRQRINPIAEPRARRYLYQLLCALDYLHANGVFHRDVKPENILLTSSGDNIYGEPVEVLKLGDLGSMKSVFERRPHTEYISTRWYRSPECLLTKGFYNSKVDIWASGCVFYEILTLQPLFPGQNEIDQLDKIHDVLGTPMINFLIKLSKHKSRNLICMFEKRCGTGLQPLMTNITGPAQDVMQKMLTYDPNTRTTVKRLLEHKYFRTFKMSREKNTITMKSLSKAPKKDVLVCSFSNVENKIAKVELKGDESFGKINATKLNSVTKTISDQFTKQIAPTSKTIKVASRKPHNQSEKPSSFFKSVKTFNTQHLQNELTYQSLGSTETNSSGMLSLKGGESIATKKTFPKKASRVKGQTKLPNLSQPKQENIKFNKTRPKKSCSVNIVNSTELTKIQRPLLSPITITTLKASKKGDIEKQKKNESLSMMHLPTKLPLPTIAETRENRSKFMNAGKHIILPKIITKEYQLGKTVAKHTIR